MVSPSGFSSNATPPFTPPMPPKVSLEQATKFAESLARAYGAELILMHVLRGEAHASDGPTPREARALAYLEALAAPLPGVPGAGVVPIFTPGGTHLIAAHSNGRAYVWDIRPASLVRQACEVAGRRLTRAEWDEFLPGREYEPAC